LSRIRRSSSLEGLAAPRRAGKITLLILACLLIAGSCGAKTPLRPEKWAQPVPSATLKNWYRLDADVYRSEQPTRKGFEEIREKGIRTILNLRDKHSDETLVEGLGFQLVEIPMKALSFSEDDVVKALKAIESAPKPVLIHCQYGADRTGVIAAMYRVVFQGWTKKEALAELTGGGFGFHRYYLNIPEFIRSADVDKIRKQLKFRIPPAAAKDKASSLLTDAYNIMEGERPGRL
jgi:tyrosine-protein phosphatase SIW14